MNHSNVKFCRDVAEHVLEFYDSDMTTFRREGEENHLAIRVQGEWKDFEPDINANDDYDMLAGIRRNWGADMRFEMFCGELSDIWQERTPFDELGGDAAGQYGSLYQIGDYSRAALAVCKSKRTKS